MTATPASTRLDPVELAAAILACLPDMTPARLRGLCIRWGGPIGALSAVQRGLATGVLCQHARAEDIPARVALARTWQQVVGNDRVLETLTGRRTRAFVAGRAGYPIDDDVPGRPEVLLAEGELPSAFEGPRVTVVSGLALGIDGAAHRGALEAGGRVVGVVATGLDVVYPRRHARLFSAVREAGVLVSELGYGSQPRPGAFPVRNRIIAALADVVVVVEATVRGGARITADRALEYGRPVLAMPGSRRNPAAAGTNALIADGAHPLLEPSDVLLALGLTPGSRRVLPPPPARGSDAARVLGACGGEPATFDQLASRTALGADQVAVAVRELERGGWMERVVGLCWPKG
jgi:DNA protecting protein DprA